MICVRPAMLLFVVAACTSFILSHAQQIQTVDKNMIVRVGRDADIILNVMSSVSLVDLEGRVNDIEMTAVPNLIAEAEMTTMDAVSGTMQRITTETDAKLASLEGKLNALASRIPSMISTTVATSMISSNNLIDQKVARVNNAIAANASSMASYVSMQTDQLTSRAKAVTPKGVVIGYKECATSRSSGADSAPYDFMSCTYAKKRADTILHIEFNSNGRQINGWSAWRFYVDNTECRGPSNEDQGDIRARWHGSNRDLHRPQTIGGFCYRGSNNRPFGAGNRLVQWRQTDEAGDSYVGWASTSRIRITEYMPNSDSYTTD